MERTGNLILISQNIFGENRPAGFGQPGKCYAKAHADSKVIYDLVEETYPIFIGDKNVPSNLISAGLYIFEPEVLENIPEGFARLEEDVFPKLANAEDLSGFVFYGKWQDIRSKEGYESARQQWEGF